MRTAIIPRVTQRTDSLDRSSRSGRIRGALARSRSMYALDRQPTGHDRTDRPGRRYWSSADVAPGSGIEYALEAMRPQLAAGHRAACTGCAADDDPSARIKLPDAPVEFLQRDVDAAFGMPVGELALTSHVDDLRSLATKLGDAAPRTIGRKDSPCEVRNDKTQEKLI